MFSAKLSKKTKKSSLFLKLRLFHRIKTKCSHSSQSMDLFPWATPTWTTSR